MEIESLFSSTRWDILQVLSKHKLSPMELAQRMNTTSANISQQLRLLELAGLVKSEKTSNVEKGKPRVIYTLAGDNAFLILASSSFSGKKLLAMTVYQKFMLKSLFIENTEHQDLLGEAYFALREHLENIDVIAAKSDAKSLGIHLVLKNKKIQETVKRSLDALKVRVSFDEAGSLRAQQAHVLYDPNRLTEEGKNG
jgi:predicted transcriptional regulator